MYFKSAKFVLEERCIIIVTPIYSAIVTGAKQVTSYIHAQMYTHTQGCKKDFEKTGL